MTPREFAIQVTNRLQEAGHTALWAGGCVRDQLLGRTPKDFDVATSALPEMVREVFGRKRTLAIGASFGVITVIGPKSAGNIEIATFRRDGGYSDGRRPDQVEFTDAKEDAIRRDFTINGMFFDPIKNQIIDYVDGQADLERKVIRAIGNPHERIEEDKLRMLRGVRFASTFAFELEEETAKAIREHAEEIKIVSSERIGNELTRMLAHRNRSIAFRLLRETKLLEKIMPESRQAMSEEWYNDRRDVFLRLEQFEDEVDFEIAAAALLGGSDKKLKGSELWDAWKLSNEQQKSILWILRNWTALKQADSKPWSVIQPLLVSANAPRAVVLASVESGEACEALEFCKARLAWPREKLDPKPFLDGADLKTLDIRPGPLFKTVLNRVRAAQLDREIETKAAAIEYAKRMIEVESGQCDG